MSQHIGALCWAEVRPLTQPLVSALHVHVLCLRSWPAVGTVSLALTVSNRHHDCCLSRSSLSQLQQLFSP